MSKETYEKFLRKYLEAIISKDRKKSQEAAKNLGNNYQSAIQASKIIREYHDLKKKQEESQALNQILKNESIKWKKKFQTQEILNQKLKSKITSKDSSAILQTFALLENGKYKEATQLTLKYPDLNRIATTIWQYSYLKNYVNSFQGRQVEPVDEININYHSRQLVRMISLINLEKSQRQKINQEYHDALQRIFSNSIEGRQYQFISPKHLNGIKELIQKHGVTATLAYKPDYSQCDPVKKVKNQKKAEGMDQNVEKFQKEPEVSADVLLLSSQSRISELMKEYQDLTQQIVQMNMMFQYLEMKTLGAIEIDQNSSLKEAIQSLQKNIKILIGEYQTLSRSQQQCPPRQQQVKNTPIISQIYEEDFVEEQFEQSRHNQFVTRQEYNNLLYSKNDLKELWTNNQEEKQFLKKQLQDEKKLILELKNEMSQFESFKQKMDDNLKKQGAKIRKMESAIAESSIDVRIDKRQIQFSQEADLPAVDSRKMDELFQKVAQLQGQNFKLKQNVRELNTKLEQYHQSQQYYQQMQKSNAILLPLKDDLNAKVDSLRKQRANLQRKVDSLQVALQQLSIRQSIGRELFTSSKDSAETKELQKQSKLMETVKMLQEQKAKTTDQNKKLDKEIRNIRQQNAELKEQVYNLEQKVRSYQNQLQEYQIFVEKQLQEKDTDIQHLSRNIEELKNSGPQGVRFTEHLFTSGDIFEGGYQFERNQLIKRLQENLNPLKRTKLIYKYEPLNRINLHKYIDNHMHIVVIAKTIYGRIIAGYSKQCFNSKGTKKGDAFLMSLWNQKTYKVKPDCKGVTYDDYFVIFGNSEIRIKALQTKVFSNFGINNGYFNNRGEKVTDFLGDNDREIELLAYEFYELHFD